MDHRSAMVVPGKSGKANYSDDWFTPPTIVQKLGHFDLDPCAGPMSHAIRNIRKPECGLAAVWDGRVWMNPPYSNIHDWLVKFIRHANGITLVNARPETVWFQNLVKGADGVLWIKGRVEFLMPEGPTKHPTVGSVLVAYGTANLEALKSSGIAGLVMALA